MKILKLSSILAVALLLFTSCSDDDVPQLEPVEAQRVSNLHAPQTGGTGQGPISGEFTKFDFSTGETTTSETEWDIAFRGTTIIVNGGQSQGATDEPNRTGNAAAYIVESDFVSVVNINEESFAQDTQAALAITPLSDMGWYNYSGPPNPNVPNSNLVTPISGRVLVFRTREGRYAKMEILSYYRDNPTASELMNFTDMMKLTEARYYTFNYVFQPNQGETTF
ncbi:heme-binding HmuY-like protein [Winogradskyella wandonensis]|uniref:Heme-binding HmuY-like protein n=1 Tax=Winogradskyella wandonensis TaxID=1442586 RepID=A0A4R1KVB7_9FLAO|nr:HmuY family protein [Winogradskyella wandonensis]TCK68643.1 heme-binding HmuY-like protein [Winogradskyella wandonensis]